jgi:excisionase family DNA binding protein
MGTSEDESVIIGEPLTVNEAAEYLHVSAKHVRRLVANRLVAHHRLGRAIRFYRSDLDAYLVACRVEPVEAS